METERDMMRMTATKATLPKTISASAITEVYEMIEKGTAEIANQNGDVVIWADTLEAEDKILQLAQTDNATIVSGFPTRYIDDGKKAVAVTPENLKEINLKQATKEYPEKYVEKHDDTPIKGDVK